MVQYSEYVGYGDEIKIHKIELCFFAWISLCHFKCKWVTIMVTYIWGQYVPKSEWPRNVT